MNKIRTFFLPLAISEMFGKLVLAFTVILTVSCGSNDPDTGGGTEGEISSSSGELESGCSADAVKIGNLCWMKKNLNALPTNPDAAQNSWCYQNNPANCETYGRVYDWATAMALPDSCKSVRCASQIQTPHHQGVCPDGFHIPTNAEWDALSCAVHPESCHYNLYNSPVAGRMLKAQNGWPQCGPMGSGQLYRCDDDVGFSALPCNVRYSNGGFSQISHHYSFCNWWTASEHENYGILYAFSREITFFEDVLRWSNDSKLLGYPVRCVQDELL
jgi:uncharacterized protein (TIGR02145 family)